MAIITNNWAIDAVTILIAALTWIYLLLKKKYSFWDRHGIKSIPNASYIFGHFRETILQREFIGDVVTQLYRKSNEPFVGIYTILRPVFLVRDPELAQSILVKDFANFTDRGVHCNEDYDPLSGHLFALPGQRWKKLRTKLTPTFTSGKLKAMFSTLVDCGSTLQNYLEKLAENGELLDAREIAASHATNVIASVAFGIETDAINNPNNEFRVCGRKIFEPCLKNGLRTFLFFSAPKVMSMIRMKVAEPSVEKFLRTVAKENLEYREKNNIVRKDFFQLLIQLRNTGAVQLDNEWETKIKTDENQKTLTEDEIAAQTFVFFVAGYETSSTTVSFCMYEIAKHPEIQQRIHNEIDTVLAAHNGQITYDSLFEMKYLENCIDETLRKYPVLPLMNRICVKDYTIPGTNCVIKEGTQVFIPALAFARDEKYYKNPDEYNPNRFSDEEKAGKNQLNQPYYPFGDGPRNCIGIRLGKMQTKTALVMMLQKFHFELDEYLKKNPLQFNPKFFFMSPSEGIHLRVSKRKIN